MLKAQDAVRAEMTQRLQAELEQAKEVARLEVEQEHLQNLQQLEENLGENHAEQLKGLADLQKNHMEEVEKLKYHHQQEFEK